MVDDRRALGRIQQPRPQADQPPGRYREHHVGIAAVRAHLDHLPPPSADQFHDRAHLVGRHFDDEALERLHRQAVLLVQDDPRFSDGKLEALPAHGFDEHGEVQQSAAGDHKGIGPLDKIHAEGHVLLQLAS